MWLSKLHDFIGNSKATEDLDTEEEEEEEEEEDEEDLDVEEDAEGSDKCIHLY